MVMCVSFDFMLWFIKHGTQVWKVYSLQKYSILCESVNMASCTVGQGCLPPLSIYVCIHLGVTCVSSNIGVTPFFSYLP